MVQETSVNTLCTTPRKNSLSSKLDNSTFKLVHPCCDYNIGRVIGCGSFAVVKECVSKETQEHYAVKIIDKSVIKECNLENEICILKQSSHPNIVKLKDVYETDENMFLILELLRGSDLFSETLSTGPYCEQQVYRLFKQIADAVQYLHSMGIAHRDLKLDNILLTEQMEAKLTDFGLSRFVELSDEAFMKTQCGTVNYVAPEIILGNGYTNQCDIWSLGVMLYVLLVVKYPFNGSSLNEIHEKIISATVEFPDDVTLSDEVKDLVKQMLTEDPQNRATIEEILQHPWMLSHQQEEEKQKQQDEQHSQPQQQQQQQQQQSAQSLSSQPHQQRQQQQHQQPHSDEIPHT